MDIWLCGGGTLAGALINEIDEIVLKRYPVIVGTGISMFSGAPSRPLDVSASPTGPDHLVQSAIGTNGAVDVAGQDVADTAV